jgi:hypothetical protein
MKNYRMSNPISRTNKKHKRRGRKERETRDLKKDS